MGGFHHWFQALQLILVSLILIGGVCVWTIMVGSAVINDLGNAPSKWVEIQTRSVWKVLVVQIIVLALVLGLFNAIS